MKKITTFLLALLMIGCSHEFLADEDEEEGYVNGVPIEQCIAEDRDVLNKVYCDAGESGDSQPVRAAEDSLFSRGDDADVSSVRGR